MIDKISKGFAKRSRNTKSKASNDSPLSGLFILPIPQMLPLSSGRGIADSGGPALKVLPDQLVSRLQIVLHSWSVSCGTRGFAKCETKVFATHVAYIVVLYQGRVPLLTSRRHALAWGLPLPGIPGLDECDGAFMERLRNLAHEALSWPHLNGQQRLMWATVLELDVVPLQERHPSFWSWVRQ